jgi:hypothetical protein
MATNHEIPSHIAAAEEHSARALRAAGFDAFVCGSESALKGGVSVRISARDPRIEWTSTRSDVAPKGYFFSCYDHTFLLHAGRAFDAQGVERVNGFVAELVARAQSMAPA